MCEHVPSGRTIVSAASETDRFYIPSNRMRYALRGSGKFVLAYRDNKMGVWGETPCLRKALVAEPVRACADWQNGWQRRVQNCQALHFSQSGAILFFAAAKNFVLSYHGNKMGVWGETPWLRMALVAEAVRACTF